MFAIQLITFVLVASVATKYVSNVSAQEARSIERAEDCEKEQYYSLDEQSCKNCSDVQQILYSYQEWLGREVGEIRNRPPGEGQDRQRANKNSYSNSNWRGNNRLNNASGNRIDDIDIKNDNNINNNNEVLSRLISVAPQDQGLVETVGPDTSTTSDNEDVSESFVSDLDIDTSVTTQTKQVQKLVNRFAQSSFIGAELLESIRQCRQNQNVTACQMWSNFCVLSMYSHSNNPTTQSSSSTSSYESRGNDLEHPRLSWQKCPQFGSSSICNSYRDWYQMEKKSIIEMQSIYASEEPLLKLGSSVALRINQPIQLLAYRYALNGELIAVDHFGLNDLASFCVMASSNQRPKDVKGPQIKVGQNMHYNCEFSNFDASWFARTRSLNDTTFIDLFIGYTSNGATVIKPVPVLIKNVLFNGALINRKYAKDQSRWKLVHRFFFHSVLTQEGHGKGVQNREDVLVYAKSVSLDFKFKRQDRSLPLSSILLSIDYGIIPKLHTNERINSTTHHLAQTHVSDITVFQTMLDMLGYRKDLDLAMTILSILSSIWSLIKCYNLQKYYGSVKLDFNSLFTFVIISCDTVANLFATVTLLFLSYLFIAVKLQFAQQMFAPSEDLENAIITNIELAFSFKVVGLIHKIYVHLTADVFFIDWEKPKMLTSSQILDHSLYYDQSKSKPPESNRTMMNPNDMQPHTNQQQQSSFWRSYTIVDRWIQMQTFRRQSISLQLIIFACVIDITHLLSLATGDSVLDVSQHSNHELTPIMSSSFRLLILASVYLALAFCQVGYRKYIHEPMIRNPAHEFVDICSVANVSLFCMLYPRFGYYIHGRNANGAGDCSIIEMNALLEREERDLCSKRGLAPNSDQQTFIMILPRIVNEHYRKLLFTNEPAIGSSQLNKQSTPNLSQLSSSNFIGSSLLKSAFKSPTSMSSTSTSFGSNRALIEMVVSRNKAINAFLTNFLEHIYKDIDYSIRAKRRFESFLLDVDFDDDNLAARGGPLSSVGQDKSQAAATFCIDHDDSFTALLWLGLELDFILIELLLVLVLDLWLGQQPMIITVGVVWFLHNLFKSFYVYCARHNLVSKALIDEKFLAR